MWHDIGPSRQNLGLSLLAVLMSLVVGIGIPLLQSSPTPRQEQITWNPPSPTPTVTDTIAPDLASEALSADMLDGALIAWQEPGPATPSSIPLASSTAGPAPSPSADAPLPGRSDTVILVDTASPTVTATVTSEPIASATPAPTATAWPDDTATPTPTSTATIIPTPQPTNSTLPVASPTDVASLSSPDTASVLAAPSGSYALALPTRPPSIQAQAAGPPAPTATVSQSAAGAAGANPSARPTNGTTAGAAVAKPTTPAASQVWPPVVIPPALLSPGLQARLRGVVQFDWYPTSMLPVGAYYEMVVWSPEQDPSQAWGVAPPRITTSLTLNLDELFRSGRFREGSLYWTVLVVEQNPYRRLTLPAESERRYLVLATGG